MTSCQDKKFRQSVQGSYGECMNKFLKISGERKLVPFSLKNRETIKMSDEFGKFLFVYICHFLSSK